MAIATEKQKLSLHFLLDESVRHWALVGDSMAGVLLLHLQTYMESEDFKHR